MANDVKIIQYRKGCTKIFLNGKEVEDVSAYSVKKDHLYACTLLTLTLVVGETFSFQLVDEDIKSEAI